MCFLRVLVDPETNGIERYKAQVPEDRELGLFKGYTQNVDSQNQDPQIKQQLKKKNQKLFLLDSKARQHTTSMS